MEIRNYRLVPEGNGYSIILSLDDLKYEFSNEFGINDQELKQSFQEELREFILHNFSNIRVNTVKIMVGTMLLGTFQIGEIATQAAVTTQTTQTVSKIPYVTYKIQRGDTLAVVAKKNGVTVDQLNRVNQLSSGSKLTVGKTIYLPFVSYKVVRGDSLSIIAKKYYSSVENIKRKNNLKTNSIKVGQRLMVPVINPPKSSNTAPPVKSVPKAVKDTVSPNKATIPVPVKVTVPQTPVQPVTIPKPPPVSTNVVAKPEATNANVEPVPIPVPVKIEPVKSVTFENNGIVNKQNSKKFTIRGNSDQEGGIVQLYISDGKQAKLEEALVLKGVFDKAIDLSVFNDGTLTVKMIQTNKDGIKSEEVTSTIQKDTSIDAAVVFNSRVERIPTGYHYRINGQGEPGATVEINVLGQTGTREIKQIMKTDENGRFEVQLNISDITKPFVTTKIIDRSGNATENTIVAITSHVVGSGDTLSGVANRYNTTIDKLTTLNNLSSTVLKIGQELKLPVVAGIISPAISEQEFFNMGYLFFGSSHTYIDNINQTSNTINVVSPSYFDLNSDGSLKLTSQFDRQFIATSQSSGVRVVPFLSNHWDRTLGENALKNREALSTQIAETVRIYNLDGINVDIENVTDAYRDEYTDFVRLLREKIPAHKEVSVAVAANPYGYTKGWHGSYNYKELAKYADYLMIMAYDESYPGSQPGPIASINFVERSIQYAINNGVAKEKMVVGVGHYGRYWKEGSTYGGEGISNLQIEKAVNLYKGTVIYDQKTQSAKAVFTIKKGDPVMTVGGKPLTEGTYTVWFENAAAIKAKIDLVHKYRIKGLGNWSIGQDNPQIWKDIYTWLKVGVTSA